MLELDALVNLPPHLEQWSVPLYCIQFQCVGLDPLLVAAVMDRESLGGDALTPHGRLGKGDDGHGHGLMQIDDRTFGAFCAAIGPDGSPLWQDSAANIYFGGRLLWFNWTRARQGRNNVADAWSVAICAYNAGLGRAFGAAGVLTGPDLIEALDAITSGKDYVSDVLKRWTTLQGAVNVPTS